MLSATLLSLSSILLYSGGANAFFRLICTAPLVTERLDPLVESGVSPSNHVHTVHGGSNFSSVYTYAGARSSSCTSCEINQDKSNYWFPKLYYKSNVSGTVTYEEVPGGGLAVYYLNRGTQDVSNGGPGLKAFPAGFRMITGSAGARAKKYPVGLGTQAELRERAIQWVCIRSADKQTVYSDSLTGQPGAKEGFPTTNCEGSLQMRLRFPACWDGKNVDSANHMDHVAYLSQIDNGVCPSTHPIGIMHLLYEVSWYIDGFASRWAGKEWPFVLANGDPTGYGWHGDFQNGWDLDVLQYAIDNCNSDENGTSSGDAHKCTKFALNSPAAMAACTSAPVVKETTGGTGLKKLPGCNPLQAGPADATFYKDSNCPIS